MYKKLYLFGLYFCLLVFSLSAKNLVIVSSQHAPYQYLENGKVVGINMDIMAEALKRLDSTFTFEFKPWQSSLFMTKYGYVDAIINTSYKEERTRYLYYPDEPVFNQSWYAFILRSSDIVLNKDFSNANQYTLGIMQNFTYGGVIQKALDKKMFKKIIYFQEHKDMIKALYSHKIDMYIDNKGTVALYYKRKHLENKTKVLDITKTNKEFLLSFGKTYLAFTKKHLDMDFINRLSAVLKDMREDGTIEQIAKKYY